jgi:hypothetical protein
MSISYTPSTRSFLISGHVTMHSRKLPFKSAYSPFAEQWRIAYRKHPLPNPLRRSFSPYGISSPNSAHKSVPFLYHFFGVNGMLQEYSDYDFCKHCLDLFFNRSKARGLLGYTHQSIFSRRKIQIQE